MNLFRTPRGRLSIMAIAVVPLLYSAAYLGAFWNPYGHLTRIPIAVVNHDGSPETRNVITQLKHTFRLTNDSPKSAQAALKNGHVGMIMTINQGFGHDLLRGKPATLGFSTDPGTNYLTSILMQREAQQIASTLSQETRQKILSKESHGIHTLTTRSQSLALGTQTIYHDSASLAHSSTVLAASATTLYQGSTRMTNGLLAWQTGISALTAGLNQWAANGQHLSDASQPLIHDSVRLSQGANSLTQGLQTLSKSDASASQATSTLSATTAPLSTSTSRLVQAAQANQQLSQSLAQAIAEDTEHPSSSNASRVYTLLQEQQALTSQVTSGLTQLNDNFTTFSARLHQVSLANQTISDSLAQAANASQPLASGLQAWHSGILTWASHMGQLSSAAGRLQSGAQHLNGETSALTRGSQSLSQGLGQWSNGVHQYRGAAGQLHDALGTLSHGTTRMTQGLNTASKPLDDIKSPITTQITTLGGGNYGTGMAPYFLGLSLWVGAIVATVLVPGGRFHRKPLDSRTGQSFGIAFLQIAFLGVGTALILPIHPDHPWAYGLSLLGIGVVWWAAIRLLVEKLGDAGRILGIVLLVIQLGGSSGTYPVLLSPALYRAIHPFLPMTWAIHLLRYTLSNGYPGLALHDIALLAGLGIVSVALTLWLPVQWSFEAPVLKEADGVKGCPESS